MPTWKFSTDTHDVADIARSLKEHGACFNPENDRIALSDAPDGYAQAWSIPTICERVRDALPPECCMRVKHPEELTLEAEDHLLIFAASSVTWIRDFRFDDVSGLIDAEPGPNSVIVPITTLG